MTSAAFPGTTSPAAALTQLHRLMSELGRGLDIEETLTAVVECVVAGLGFGVAVVSVVRPGGDLQVAAVAGDPDARATLDGSWSTRTEWDRLLGLGTEAGPGRLLRLIDHRQGDVWLEESIRSWVPAAVPAAPAAGAPPVDAEPAWHPLDALFAPLVSPTEGLLGVLSVDVPVNGRWPSTEQLGLLEMFAVQAAVAVEHSRLHSVIVAAKEQARAALAVRLRSVVDASPAALVEIDRAGDVREWNRAAALLFGEEAADVLGRPLPAFFGEVDLARVFGTLDGGGTFPMLQLRCRRRDGSEVDVELSAAPTLGPQGEVHGVMGLMVDVTERRELQARLERRSTHDDLTGLPNRLLLNERLEAALAAAAGCTAVLVLDLDRFKEVNDTLGHHHGDLLLAAIGPRLARLLRPSDTLARLSGDEFAVVLPELADPAAAALVAARVLEALHEPFDLDGVTVDMEASVGVSVSPQDGTDPTLLLRRADIARYQAKELSAGVVSYQQERGGRAPGRLALLGELRRALEGDELTVHYQPKIDIRTGLLCGMEALVRWQHPTRGLLSPADFVPVAEGTGLVTRLTLRVLDLVLAQLSEWAAAGEAVPVALNLSARCLHDLTLPDAVAAALARYAVPPGLLRIEITESAIMSDPVRALAILQRLADGGVRLSIDDFGTGYSSMTYLRQLPVDELKVDQSFVSDLSDALSDQVLVRSAVDLGHNLGLSVVAEGVEDAPTLAALADLGCDVAQGYLFARPMPAAALPGWREQHRASREARARPRTPQQRAAPPAGLQVPSP